MKVKVCTFICMKKVQNIKLLSYILLKNPGEMWRELHKAFLSTEISKNTDSEITSRSLSKYLGQCFSQRETGQFP